MSILTLTLQSMESTGVQWTKEIKVDPNQEVYVWEKENGRQAKIKAKFIRRSGDLLILGDEHFEILELSTK